MKRVCAISRKEFTVTDDDLKFYEKMEVPVPTLCPEERQRWRLAWRNERSLYRRNCDMCKQSMIATYDKDVIFPVYCRDCWLSDKWDAKKLGQDFDFNRPLFEQFHDLLKEVPKLAVINERSENSEFTHYSDQNKNGFLLVGTARCEDCMFGYRSFDIKDCVDCAFLSESEMCYECIDSENLYECVYCLRCKNSRNLKVCHDCENCKNCFGCTNLRNKEFCWGNQQLTPTEFSKKLKQQDCSWENFDALRKSGIFRATKCIQCEDCKGDNITKSKNCQQCFDVSESEHCNYCMSATKNNNCADTEFIDQSSWCWNGSSQERNNNCICCAVVWYSNDMMYCENCVSSHDLLGCIGMRHAAYCILNKQYSKEEYFTLREKILKHMKQTGEFGEFFPIQFAPFAYNETIAMEHFPLTKKEVLERKWKWKDDRQKDHQTATISKLPNDIVDITDTICKEILACEKCKKNYKIQKQELKFYRKMTLSIPRKCPNCRHVERLKLRNPRHLWNRNCDKCSAEIQTTFSPERHEKVYCEKCYLDEVN